MNSNDIKAMIRRHEGYRDTIYLDTVGVPTGGYGHALHIGSRLPKAVWEQVFDYDYAQAEIDYEKLNLDLDPVRRAVVIDMLFNLGLSKLRRFKKMLQALREYKFVTAAAEMERSKWFKQVGNRAIELRDMMLGDLL